METKGFHANRKKPLKLFARSLGCVLLLCLLAGTNEAAEPMESALIGFPAIYTLQGNKLANGEFVQKLEKDLLHVRITYEFGDGHRVEEKAVFRQMPVFTQEKWAWIESKRGEVLRQFQVDFKSGRAIAEKKDKGEVKRVVEELNVEPGKTFAGFGFVLAIKSLRERLIKGEPIELRAIAFTPKARVVPVELSYAGIDQMSMSNRLVKGDGFVIHPKIPAIAKVFV
ncbi:MAG TPA: hypothetical protein VFD66_03890, partial [Verrucomicrobiae bacterium]|nr:hypothetical protein [Verrucomicrobiae bacterium]